MLASPAPNAALLYWLAALYAGGWQPPLIAVMVVAFGSLPAGAGFAWIDRASRREVGRLPSSVLGNP